MKRRDLREGSFFADWKEDGGADCVSGVLIIWGGGDDWLWNWGLGGMDYGEEICYGVLGSWGSSAVLMVSCVVRRLSGKKHVALAL